MFSRLRSFTQRISKLEIGNQFFLYGIFFLPSISFIGIFLLFAALIISLKKFNTSLLKDKWNYPLFLSLGLMILSTLNVTIFNNPYSFKDFGTQIIWFNLLKWLIIKICFYGFQNFLADNIKENCCKILVAGTIQ